MSVVYSCHRITTAQQREEEDDHGILDNANRTLTLHPDNKTFAFLYHYYYQYENSYYKVQTCLTNDTEFKGTYEQEGSKITATITSGFQKSVDSVKKKVIFKSDKLSGKIQFIEDGDALKVMKADLLPAKLDRKQEMMRPNMVYRKIK